ncbi:hypothetical protein LEP1GSC194_4113 [Leptospira alstonii serovar Sichuan str. 79601]|uniref:Uncharacterized protein n=1 Tax=Leptospira alstonii serovar Sichuan str. 79601 TaxID=1218565 RepID=M6CIL4_9LEPT|nr:hypothetical protein LEP1GSC194_4113 [Leptospira alstonii serovar Sichuan str. 79601]
MLVFYFLRIISCNFLKKNHDLGRFYLFVFSQNYLILGETGFRVRI